jgi:hypothetical protein
MKYELYIKNKFGTFFLQLFNIIGGIKELGMIDRW